MPVDNNANKRIPEMEQTGTGSYDRILAIYRSDAGNSSYGKQKKAFIGFKNYSSFETAIQDMSGSGTYDSLAGADLSNLFFPFKTTYTNGVMPKFYPSGIPTLYTINSGVVLNLNKLLPFKWNAAESGTIYYRPNIGSGHDAMNAIVNSERYYGSTEVYRDISNIRTIGMRLPMMGVGWGYDTHGLPVPSQDGGFYGSGVQDYSSYTFKGGFANGYEVDPNDYIAAPIDLRYDAQKNVWTGPKGFWAQIQTGSGVYVTASGIFANSGSGLITAYSWTEKVPGDTGQFIIPTKYRTGSFTKMPAFEVNSVSVPDSAIVYLVPKDREDRYYFAYGGAAASGSLSTGQYQYMHYQMTSQNSAGWDFPRGAPVIE